MIRFLLAVIFSLVCGFIGFHYFESYVIEIIGGIFGFAIPYLTRLINGDILDAIEFIDFD